MRTATLMTIHNMRGGFYINMDITIFPIRRHNTFGGEIEIDDFSTTSPSKQRITNQTAANNLSKLIAQEQKQREENEMYKSMTLDKLVNLGIISKTDGRPSPTLTDEMWQKEFRVRKLFIQPYDKSVRRFGGKYSRESGSWNDSTAEQYHGATDWQNYCSFINDTLQCIREGQVSYCYYANQIFDLAKFHYDALRTKLCDGYWEVWLERG